MSETAKRALRNTALLIALRIANPLISMVLIGLMSRRLGPEGVGAYNLLLSFFFIVHDVTTLGLNPLVTREVSRSPNQALSYLCSAALLGGAVSLLGAGGLVSGIHLADYGLLVEKGAWLVALSLLPAIVIFYSEAIFVAYEKIQYVVYISLLENLGKVLLGIWLIYSGYGVVALIGSFAVFRCLAFLAHLGAFHRQIMPLRWKFDTAVVRRLATDVPIFGGILLVATLRWRADILILSKMSSMAAVGFYSVAHRLFAICRVIPKSFYTSIYPILARLFRDSYKSFQAANSLSIRYILVAMLPVSAIIYGVTEPLVVFLFGSDFAPAASALGILVWALVPYGLGRVMAAGVYTANLQAMDLKVNLIALAGNLAMNFLLIPRYGFVGCAWALLFSATLVPVCLALFQGRAILPVLRQAELFRPLLATGGILIWMYLTPALPFMLRMLGGGVIYLVLLLVLGVVRVSDLRQVLPSGLAWVLPGERK